MHPAQASQRDSVLADLNVLTDRYPDMSPLVDLYRDIDRLQAQLSDKIAVQQSPPLPQPLPVAVAQAMLDAGQPLLTFDDIPLIEGQFAQEVGNMRACLERHGVGASEESRGEDDLDEGSPGALVAWARQGFELREGPIGPTFQRSLTTLAVAQVLVAYLRAAARNWLAHFDPTLWYRGHCPMCGGGPDVALLDRQSGLRTLVCGRCDTLWPYRRVGCPFCSDDQAGDYFVSERDDFRVYRCRSCGSYLKQIRWPTQEGLRSLLGLRLLTIGLDLEAERAGELSEKQELATDDG